MAARLRHDADERPSRELAVRSGVRRLSLVMRPENMRSAKQLCMGHRVPAYYIGDVREKEAHANLTPDGFLALGVREEGALDCLLGLFVEFDSGNVAVAPAAEQLWQYLALAASGAPARRLPDFAVPGYTLPLLFVTQHRSTLRGHAIPKAATELDTRRVHALADAFRARIVKVRWEDATMAACPLPPLFLATHGELQQYGWDCPVLSLHQVGNERWPLLRALLRDAGPLLQAARLGAGDVARIDLSGASGVVGGNRTALTRAQHQERELLAAAQQRALDELDEVTYEARVGGAA